MMTFIMSRPPRSNVRGASAGPSAHALEAPADPGLARLIDRARWLDEIDNRLRQSLPATLAGHCRLANVDDKQLVFLAEGPVWKSKLRLHADALLGAAAAAGLPGRTLVVKVSWPEPVAPQGAAAGRPLSQAVRESLRATAESVQDPGLRAQLLRLASLPGPKTDGA